MTSTSAPPRFEATIRAACLGYPGAHEDHPWGDTVFKVRGKVFVFMGAGPDGFGISTKLPQSNAVALMLPFATPTGYGLGKSGWVSAKFGAADPIPYDLLREWIDESYRAVAPKKLVEQLPAAAAPAEEAPTGPAPAPPASPASRPSRKRRASGGTSAVKAPAPAPKKRGRKPKSA